MSAIKDGGSTITLNGKEHRLLFSLNALDEVQTRFGGYDKLDEKFNESNPDMFKDLRWMLTVLINEGLEDGEDELTEKKVGKMIHLGNMKEVTNAIYETFAKAMRGDGTSKKEEEVEEGNVETAQE